MSAEVTAAEWERIVGAPKPPCKRPLPDGRRCCECPGCHPTSREMVEWLDRLCPNPKCRDGSVLGGAKGDLLCPECLRDGRVKPKSVTMIGGPKP